MRRQARLSAGGALVGRTASALQVWLWLLIFVFQNEFRISRSIQPGYLDFDNLPETNFTCAGKVIGGYYADLEASCQMFHVCTVGQQDEPMDIKFLCLNGTVFDQETRVCERVDEVDCTKSEKFYSLNLELYGSTLAPIIEPDILKTKTTTENSRKSNQRHEIKDQNIESSTTYKPQSQKPEIIDSTEDPMQDFKKEVVNNLKVHPIHPIISEHEEPEEENQEEEEIDSEDYDDYTHSPTTTTQASITSTTLRPMPSSTSGQLRTSSRQPSPTLSSLSPPVISSSLASSSQQPTVDPSLLSPQDFIYHHRGPGSEAISFQRQSFRPADGVFITHAPPQQFDHFEYESSRTAPRPAVARPVPFVHRPQPAPFKPTTLDPRNQLLRPGPSSQSSERHETIQSRPYLPPLPPQQPLPYDPYYFDRKRSDDLSQENESFLSARSVAPPPSTEKPRTEKPRTKFKSPPRVIVTASASVSDSNGKRLNYSVGNVVSAVKPIVPINYDDYKESDLIFDPFFLDVPKLQKRRKSRASKDKTTYPSNSLFRSSVVEITSLPNISKRSTTKIQRITTPSTTTFAWNPDDYVDDNYEPHAFIPQEVPFVQLVPPNKFKKVERQTMKLVNVKSRGKFRFGDISKPTIASQAQSSSQSEGRSPVKVVLPSSLPPAPSLLAPSCGNSQDCRNRA